MNDEYRISAHWLCVNPFCRKAYCSAVVEKREWNKASLKGILCIAILDRKISWKVLHTHGKEIEIQSTYIKCINVVLSCRSAKRTRCSNVSSFRCIIIVSILLQSCITLVYAQSATMGKDFQFRFHLLDEQLCLHHDNFAVCSLVVPLHAWQKDAWVCVRNFIMCVFPQDFFNQELFLWVWTDQHQNMLAIRIL